MHTIAKINNQQQWLSRKCANEVCKSILWHDAILAHIAESVIGLCYLGAICVMFAGNLTTAQIIHFYATIKRLKSLKGKVCSDSSTLSEAYYLRLITCLDIRYAYSVFDPFLSTRLVL